MDKYLETAYSSEMYMTFILEETYEERDNEYILISREVKGFYDGEPDDELTKEYYGNFKVEYN
jgi:hypothetical protein